MMDHSAKAKFILALHKHSLQAFDSGGAVGAGTPTASSVAGQGNTGGAGLTNPTGGSFTASPWVNPYGAAIGGANNVVSNVASGVGGVVGGIASDFTTQNGYQAQLANTDNSSYGSAISQAASNALSGYDQSQNIQQQQQALANQLGQEASGQGPNPAQAALAQQTGQNVAQQASLAAGQRGASGNVGLMARQNAQTGAATQQSATGQAATLQAQQQLSAQQALQTQQQNISSGNIAEQGVNANLLGTTSSAQNTQNANNIQNMNMAQGINSQVSQNNANATNKTESGFLGGLSSITSLLAKGGMVKRYADGGSVANVSTPNLANDAAVASSNGFGSQSTSGGSGGGGGGAGGLLALLAGGGEVSSHIGKLLKHGKFSPQLAARGGTVNVTGPGQKAVTKGDSYKNDKVPALLSEGEIVIDKNTLNQKDPVKAAADFVRKTLAQRQAKAGMRA
jgi:hypothetical protein